MYKIGPDLEKLAGLGIQASVVSRPVINKDKRDILENMLRLKPEEDGLVLRTANESQVAFAIIVEAVADQNVAIVISSGKKGWDLGRLNPVIKTDETQIFIRLVSTYPVEGGYSTKPQDNALRIVLTIDGQLRIFSIGVISRLYDESDEGGQGAYHFLVIQEMYNAQLYLNGTGEIVTNNSEIVTDPEEYQGFNQWPDMRCLVDEMIVNRSELPILTSPVHKKKTVKLPKEGLARVIFYDVRKGFGFAETTHGSVYFHWTQTELEDRLPHFYTGQLLRYSEIGKGPRGSQLLEVQVA